MLIRIRSISVMAFVVSGLVASLVLSGCSAGDNGTPTTTPVSGATSAPPTVTVQQSTPSPDATSAATPTATTVPVSGLPDGPLLALSPASGTTVASQAVLVRGTVESGATARVNGVLMDPDLSGGFFVAVALGRGENIITVEVVGPTGTIVRRELQVTGV